MERKRTGFPEGIRRDVRHDQRNRCAYCGTLCRGQQFHEPRLEVHHNVPRSVGGANNRRNAVGLCGKHPDGGCGCHAVFDQLYFDRQKTFTTIMMEEGRIYELKMLGLSTRPARGHVVPAGAFLEEGGIRNGRN